MKNTGKILLALVLSGSLSAVSAVEEVSPFSANLTVTSDYVWRGKTQTLDQPTIQIGADYADESGFAVGAWASKVDFGDASTEVDLYGSFSGEVDEIGYTVGVIAYRYPGADSANFEELYFGGSYAGVDLTYYLGLSNAPNYVEVGYSASVIDDFDLSLSLGKYDDADGTQNGYKVYGIGTGTNYSGVDLSLDYTVAKNNNNSKDAKNLVFSITQVF
ncbi:MAG: hypothetical protein HAW58_03200 [Candidatus Thioglobus sp.]|nr:hypothetical protein [Candidatus Thioglobus sp.]